MRAPVSASTTSSPNVSPPSLRRRRARDAADAEPNAAPLREQLEAARRRCRELEERAARAEQAVLEAHSHVETLHGQIDEMNGLIVAFAGSDSQMSNPGLLRRRVPVVPNALMARFRALGLRDFTREARAPGSIAEAGHATITL